MVMTADRSAAIVSWMRAQRWYGDKSRSIHSHAFESLGTVECGAARVNLMTIDCVFEDGGRSTYFIPLEREGFGNDGAGSMIDGFEKSEFLDWLVSGFQQGRILDGADRRFTWLPSNDSAASAATAGTARLLRSEQTNTSILYGECAIAKVFRRLQPGVNPDVEIIQYLTEKTGYGHVPRHLGTLVIATEQAEDYVTLATFQGFIANRGDGWTWLHRELRAGSGKTRNDLLESIELLGTRTAELHAALALPTTDTALAPEMLGEEEADLMIRRLIDELDQTMSSLRTSLASSEPGLRELRQKIIGKVATVHPLIGFPKTRIHGDYHLGQVLRMTSDFAIIDFEGEPSRPLEQRREKVSPLKDVAGMLRSLDYAVATRERLRGVPAIPNIRGWGQRARAAFLAGYSTSIRSVRPDLLPVDDQEFDAALDFFMIDKALYEIRYEMDNRPEWLEIPLRALETIADHP